MHFFFPFFLLCLSASADVGEDNAKINDLRVELSQALIEVPKLREQLEQTRAENLRLQKELLRTQEEAASAEKLCDQDIAELGKVIHQLQEGK